MINQTDDEPITDDSPLARLQAARWQCECGIADADAYLHAEWLEPYAAAYQNRKLWWLTTRDAVDRAIAALQPVPIDALTALRTRRRQCEAMIDRKPAERRVWADKAMRVQAKIEAIEAGL
jgi:hypothetical protein